MTGPLFDATLLPLRRARGATMGGDHFLYERAFVDCLDRLALVARTFSSGLIYGPVLPGWVEGLHAAGIGHVTAIEPGDDTLPPAMPDLCLSIGALDTAEDLPGLLTALRHILAPGALFLGAFAGGDSLPALRTAMIAADQAEGGASAHVHPRIDPPSFAALLANAGFVAPVVDVDRVSLRYSSLDALVRDLRGMAATNRLVARPRRPVLRRGVAAARAAFSAAAVDGRTTEIVEIIHFAAWTPDDANSQSSLTNY
jgi:NADH dehydrogenase [ubiquinone] 1 alpha subcomplex assembly factor 5